MAEQSPKNINNLVAYANAVCAGASLMMLADGFNFPFADSMNELSFTLFVFSLPTNIFAWLLADNINWTQTANRKSMFLRGIASLGIISVILALGLWISKISSTAFIVYGTLLMAILIFLFAKND